MIFCLQLSSENLVMQGYCDDRNLDYILTAFILCMIYITDMVENYFKNIGKCQVIGNISFHENRAVLIETSSWKLS